MTYAPIAKKALLGRGLGWPAAFFSLIVALSAGFFLVPGGIEGKALAVLHGLCAQQPHHSLYFGEQRLPFDSRMTGIYGGFTVTVLYLIARGRWRTGGIPTAIPGITLLAGVAALGFDGVNSTLDDIGLWHLYTPMNELRLATGLMLGMALATFVWLLVNQIAFSERITRKGSIWPGVGDFLGCIFCQLAFAAVVLTRWEPLRVPLSFLLIWSAIAAVGGLLIGLIIMYRRTENQAVKTADLARPATVALIWAIIFMAVLSGGRFLLEAYSGISTTT
ncbi:MAG: DUF2085 domain-containing protein [Chloroflexota bacterium]